MTTIIIIMIILLIIITKIFRKYFVQRAILHKKMNSRTLKTFTQHLILTSE